MTQPVKATNEDLVAAYQQFGSVWKAAKSLGMCGQSVWERLRSLGVPLYSQAWTQEETTELEALAPQCTLGEISRRLGRTYAGVACKVSELGIGVRFGNRVQGSIKRGAGMTKVATARYLRELDAFKGSLRQFCVHRGLQVETLVQGIQRHHKDGWDRYATTHSGLETKTCPQCKREFIPMSTKQVTCSRRCGSLQRSDRKYFGGRRGTAIGMDEGICQLCNKEKPRLAAHHLYGKQNDPDNEHLVALCCGCHSLVGTIGSRSDVQTQDFWENLIALAITRKLGSQRPLGFYVSVDIDEINEEPGLS